eukprot:5907321-Ditylum_brightwellii.AAC.1
MNTSRDLIASPEKTKKKKKLRIRKNVKKLISKTKGSSSSAASEDQSHADNSVSTKDDHHSVIPTTGTTRRNTTQVHFTNSTSEESSNDMPMNGVTRSEPDRAYRRTTKKSHVEPGTEIKQSLKPPSLASAKALYERGRIFEKHQKYNNAAKCYNEALAMYKYLHAKEEEAKVQRCLDKISKGVTVSLDDYGSQYAAADQEKREGVLKEVE